MKNSYLNDVLTFKVYLRVIQKKKKQKYIVNKPKKRRRKYIKRFTIYTC